MCSQARNCAGGWLKAVWPVAGPGGKSVKKRLLVVDDEPDIGEYIKVVAEAMGFDVEVTTSVWDFLECYDREEPSLMCVDVVMPEMDGLELLKMLNERNCQSPILVISGYNKLYLQSAENLGEAFGLPYVKSMTKPLELAALRSALAEAC